MPVIDHTRQIIENNWQFADEQTAAVPHMIWPLDKLLAAGSDCVPARRGVVVGPAVDVASLAPILGKIDLVAVEFPKFSDGRGFTIARNLREKYGFAGDVRACGHVIPDQFAALMACGFSSVQTPAQHPPAQWQAAVAGDDAAVHVQMLSRMISR